MQTPFVMGIFHPAIYIPIGLEESERSYIICHEQVHIKRFDYLIKPLAYLILCIHWFNPLVWVSFLLIDVYKRQVWEEPDTVEYRDGRIYFCHKNGKTVVRETAKQQGFTDASMELIPDSISGRVFGGLMGLAGAKRRDACTLVNRCV